MFLSFEDLTPGWTSLSRPLDVPREDILAFANRFDAQDFHTDEVAAKASFVGALIGSGWHSAAIMMRLVAEDFILRSRSSGSPGIEELRWLKPLRPGDTVRARSTVVEARGSRSRPDFGLVLFRFELLNQHDDVLVEQTNWIMFGRAHLPPPPLVVAEWTVRYAAPGLPPISLPEAPAEGPVPSFDAMPLKEWRDLGTYTFTDAEILAFARAFDPQYFHTDPVAAKQSALGGFCASGWHTAAVWMLLMVEDRKRRARAASAFGGLPRLGPSPGFRNLRWIRPVFAGETLRYESAVIDKRASASRPGWGLLFNQNRARNAAGEIVFSFDGCVFCER